MREILFIQGVIFGGRIKETGNGKLSMEYTYYVRGAKYCNVKCQTFSWNLKSRPE